jgi:hypothetical protein
MLIPHLVLYLMLILHLVYLLFRGQIIEIVQTTTFNTTHHLWYSHYVFNHLAPLFSTYPVPLTPHPKTGSKC